MNIELASYAIGSLTGAEHALVQHHTRYCHACRDELADIVGVVGLLNLINVDQIKSLPPTATARLLKDSPERVPRRRPDPEPRITDAELLTLSVLAATAGWLIGVLAGIRGCGGMTCGRLHADRVRSVKGSRARL